MKKNLIVSIIVILLSGLLVNFSEAAPFSLPEGFLIFKLGDTKENVTKNVTETYGVRNNAVTSGQTINYAPDFIISDVIFTRPSELILGAKVDSIKCVFRNNQLFRIEILFTRGTPRNFHKDLSDALKSRYKEFNTFHGQAEIGDTQLFLSEETPAGLFTPRIDPGITVFISSLMTEWNNQRFQQTRNQEELRKQNIQDQL